MIWKEIGKAINDTLFRGAIKPLNRIVEDEAHGMFYNTALAIETGAGDRDFSIVPHGTVKIQNSEFVDYEYKSIILPNTLKSIGNFAFSGSDINSIIIPPSVSFIGEGAFMSCLNLTNVILPNHLKIIKKNILAGSSIITLSIPTEVKEINQFAFTQCHSLHTVTFDGTPSSIASNIFQECNALSDIYVPWSEGDVAGAPWGAPYANIHYNGEV